MKKIVSLLLLLLVVPFAVYAEKGLEVSREVAINAPVDKVWAVMGNFTDMSWNPLIVKTEIVEGEAEVPGAVRVLTLNDGSQITEQLVSFQPEENIYTYTITDSVLPISEYESHISAMSKDGTTLVKWEARYATDTTADADMAAPVIQELFEAGLAGLKMKAEQ